MHTDDSSTALLETFAQAASGLLYPSETDAPLDPWAWPGAEAPAVENVAAAVGKEGAEVTEVPFDDLWAPVTEGEPRFGALAGKLREALTDLRVYRVGKVDIDVVVVGKTEAGAWIGLRTKLVET